MAGSKIAESLEKLVKSSSNLIGTMQTGINKVLWGSANTQPVQTVKYTPSTTPGQTGSVSYVSNIPANPTPPKANLVNSGLFNALDALNSVDLCNVISYATDTINIKAKKKKNDPPESAAQAALYELQEQAAIVKGYIDKYEAYPNVFIGTYVGVGPNAVPPQQAASESNAPVQGGTAVSAYNLYFLMKSIGSAFSATTNNTGSLFTAEEKTLLSTVPGLASSLNIINDFVGTTDKYTDYRQISNAELVRLRKKVSTIRSVCVTVQNADFKSALALTGNFLGTDVRSQIQKLSKFVDPTQIIPTLKQINSSLQSFIRIARQIQGVIRLGQFVIKLGILFYKIFKFIIVFFGALPAPSMFLTAGAQTKIQDAKNKAKDESDGVMRILQGINALLSVALTFVRYVLANANELLIRLRTLLTTLEACDAMKDSPILLELNQTYNNLNKLKDELEAYVIQYDSKTDPNVAIFGGYEIKVIDEEITDRSVQNKRRRGVALNQRGELVTASDLTFATNTAVIIEEVKQKLVSLGLVQPGLGTINGADLAILSESLDYLEGNDVLADDLNLSQETIDSLRPDTGDNIDENQGLGINAFINNLKGGKKLRRRVRAAMSQATQDVKTKIQKEKETSSQTLFSNTV